MRSTLSCMGPVDVTDALDVDPDEPLGATVMEVIFATRDSDSSLNRNSSTAKYPPATEIGGGIVDVLVPAPGGCGEMDMKSTAESSAAALIRVMMLGS